MNSITTEEYQELFNKYIVDFKTPFTSTHIVFLQLECARWYYIDHIRSEYQDDLKTFASSFLSMICKQKSGFDSILINLDDLFIEFEVFQKNTLRCGIFCLNINKTHVIIVKEKYSHLWGLPKGKCWPEEEPQQCAQREFQEEIKGIDCSEGIFSKPIIVPYRTPFYVYRVETKSSETKIVTLNDSREIEEVKWISLRELQQLSENEKNSSLGSWVLQRIFTMWIRSDKTKRNKRRSDKSTNAFNLEPVKHEP